MYFFDLSKDRGVPNSKKPILNSNFESFLFLQYFVNSIGECYN